MLEGLEISIIKKNTAKNSVNETRWDSEYYIKNITKSLEILEKCKTINLGQLCNFIKKGIFDISPDYYVKTGIPFIRTTEIKDPNIDFNSIVFLEEKVHDANNKTELRPYDIVFTKIGSYIGDVALLPNTYTKYNFSQNVAGASLNDQKYGAFLLFFFISKYGQMQIKRSSMLSGQGKLELSDIRHYKIPIFSDSLLSLLTLTMDKINDLKNKANACYNYSLKFLNEMLSIDPDKFQKKSITNKSFSDVVNNNRLDAEYYNPKYDELFSHLREYKTKRLSEIVEIQKSIEPGSDAYIDKGIPFIRVGNLTKFKISNSNIYLSQEKYNDVVRPKKNTILLSKDGSVGIAYKVNSDLNIITSGAILHLILIDDEIMPDYLTLVLNSIVVKMQAERDAGGSIIQHWKPSEIGNVIIPILEPEAQQEISNKVRDSFKLREESERLLSLAKTVVEIAIEQGEDKAVELLDSEIS